MLPTLTPSKDEIFHWVRKVGVQYKVQAPHAGPIGSNRFADLTSRLNDIVGGQRDGVWM